MISYKNWKLLNESIGTSTMIGISSPHAVGVVGASYAVPVQDEARKQPKNDVSMVDVEEEPQMDDESDEDAHCDCECGCKKCAKTRKSHGQEPEAKEESKNYFGNGMETFFCSCGASNGKDGMCTKCNKFVVQESYDLLSVANSALKWYAGDDSKLYEFASYALHGYSPDKELMESTVLEIDNLIRKKQSEGQSHDSLRELALLRYQVQKTQ